MLYKSHEILQKTPRSRKDIKIDQTQCNHQEELKGGGMFKRKNKGVIRPQLILPPRRHTWCMHVLFTSMATCAKRKQTIGAVAPFV